MDSNASRSAQKRSLAYEFAEPIKLLKKHAHGWERRSQPCAFPLKFHDYFAKAPTRQSADAKEANCTPKETAAWKR